MLSAANTSATVCRTHTACSRAEGGALYGPAATAVGVVRGRSVGWDGATGAPGGEGAAVGGVPTRTAVGEGNGASVAVSSPTTVGVGVRVGSGVSVGLRVFVGKGVMEGGGVQVGEGVKVAGGTCVSVTAIQNEAVRPSVSR